MRNGRQNWVALLLALTCLTGGCARTEENSTGPQPEQTWVTEAMTDAAAETQVPQTTQAQEAELPEARRITSDYRILPEGEDRLEDESYLTKVEAGPDQPLVLESSQGIGGIYVQWDMAPEGFRLVWEQGSLTCGKEGFLHEYVSLPEPVSRLELVPEGDAAICELALYTLGAPPENVQTWLPPCTRADILVFPTHADDDTLFFGALIAHYAIARGKTVQTAFLTDHWYEPVRNHERLDGLWALGVRHYPVVGSARDYNAGSLEQARHFHRNDDLLGWQVAQLRRFQPLVAVGHDLKGEYGHSQHRLNAHTLVQAVEAAGDASLYPDSAGQYGIWNTPKLYLHLYPENSLTLEVNTPLAGDSLGRTAFEIAEAAYACHKSQQQYYFRVRQEEPTMDCRKFGLYRSLVGMDSGGDILEHTGFILREE